ncbi:unnamed protein product [Caenorhabditis angaria]|uniref:Uncharacterized protein n=1 Tax=Caenorhabditis angaria TaxID=860376 RepID=A0A9P1IC31_9PELO|nr:unnamed protein product [Caenorhabditis angaria]
MSFGNRRSEISTHLYTFSMIVSTISTFMHFLIDGPISIQLFSSIVFSIVLHFKSINLHISELNYNLRRNFIPTFSIIFSTTWLASLRAAVLSIDSSANDVSLYLAYLTLFMAFTENLQQFTESYSFDHYHSEYRQEDVNQFLPGLRIAAAG